MGGFRAATVTEDTTVDTGNGWININNVNDLDSATIATQDTTLDLIASDHVTHLISSDFSGDLGTGAQDVIIRWAGSFHLKTLNALFGDTEYRVDLVWKKSAAASEESRRLFTFSIDSGDNFSGVNLAFDEVEVVTSVVPAELVVKFRIQQVGGVAEQDHSATMSNMVVTIGDSIGGRLF